MRLILIRHGQTDSNLNRLLDTAHPGAPLNDTGQQQAAALVHQLADERIDALYASTLTRAQETAAPLAEARGLEVEIIDGIQEIAAGVEEMNADWTRYVGVLETWSPDNLDVGVEGGETAREFLTRYSEAMRKIEADGHEVAALVSHGAAMRVMG
ncbi:MAG: histidine phosphatase family protein, partial [Propionibacterium sp.]|nr:histidine phosphatase family protein [Propionibacterium sp.]